MIIPIKNPNVSQSEKTYLSAPYTSGTTLSETSSENFAVNDLILVGEPGDERAELAQITAIPDVDSVTILSALQWSHPKDTPIYKVSFDKFSLEFRTSSAGTFAAIAGMPLPLQWDSKKQETIYDHTSGQLTYEYRVRLYNSVTANYSSYSDTIEGSGYERNQVGYMVQRVWKKTRDTTQRLTSSNEIISLFNECVQSEISPYIDSSWVTWVDDDEAITSEVGVDKYALPVNFDMLDKLVLGYINGSSSENIPLTYLTPRQMDTYTYDNNATNEDRVTAYTIIPGDATSPNGYIKFNRKFATAGLFVKMRYWKYLTDMDSFGDTVPFPIATPCEDYASWRIEEDRGNDTRADRFRKDFERGLVLLRKSVKRQIKQPKGFKFMGQRPYHNMRIRRTQSDIINYW